jgi:transcriptional regulator with XRE-family HTH domain
MQPIEQLRKHIKTLHPQTSVTLTPPLRKDGVWSMDVALGHKRLVVEWSLATGFGLSSLSDDSYGERPDETFKTVEDVNRRISDLLSSEGRTSPPLGVLLSRLRESRGLTQQELAARLGVRQATVSGMERRDDMQFSTLRRVIEALEGALEICALFPEGKYLLSACSTDASIKILLGELETIEGADINYEKTFPALRESGELARAKRQAHNISSRHAVLEMAD